MGLLGEQATGGGGKTPLSQRMVAIAAQARAAFVSPSPLKMAGLCAGMGTAGVLLPPPPPPARLTFSPRPSDECESHPAAPPQEAGISRRGRVAHFRMRQSSHENAGCPFRRHS